ncbi:MAG: helix-turn-helix domain-containing protein [Deltaproteobacteria bacterium]|nr:helix-turn-helix domain-containing protein [Deltaproteobacteria bacterium]
MNEFEGLGPALRRLREGRGLTQREVAERCGTARRVINSVETGRSLPRVPTLEAMLESLGSDLFELLNTLEAVNGRSPVRFRRLVAKPQQRHRRLMELLGLEDLPEKRQDLFLAAAEDLRNLFSHLVTLSESLKESEEPEPVQEKVSQTP